MNRFQLQQQSLQAWCRKNLFASLWDTGLTVCVGLGLVWVLWHIFNWVFFQAQWQVIQVNWLRFLVGRYPAAQLWRVGLVVALLAFWFGLRPWLEKRLLGFGAWMFPVLALLSVWLIAGGWGLAPVATSFWNGLLLTLLVSLASILLAFPLGILLAVGRQSQLPVWRYGAAAYIELVRGLPLIGILFMAQVMLPLILPEAWRLDRLLRAVLGLVLFNAAYLAENIRGGWQAIPKGQFEAAKALGFNPFLVTSLVVLPQALRISVPAITGQFISLLKDTALLSLFALLELTGVARSILAQPEFLGRYGEVYLFIGVIYWLFCFGLSWWSRRFERVVH